MKKKKIGFALCLLAVFHLVVASTLAAPTDPVPPQAYLQFDGTTTNYVEVPDSTDFSVDTTGGLTISAWMRPDALTFANTEGSRPDEQFVHWLGKGSSGQQEWVFRMYSITDPAGARENRISFYVFEGNTPPPIRGCGSYFQDPVQAGQWIHVVGVADNSAMTTTIYKDGVLRNTNSYAGIVTPGHGTTPLRMGTRDFASFFKGALAEVRVWNRALNDQEIADLYFLGAVPQDALVGEYLLNEGAGSTAFDTSGWAHDGTVFGAAWGSGSSPLQSGTGRSGGGC
ncbi:MAG TPA: LamG domain-containing protein [Candidatus Dormibacteraeota bacterium]|nr:LamG domain-containing protein [Candidatus Dormibacteraeota bacterium]